MRAIHMSSVKFPMPAKHRCSARMLFVTIIACLEITATSGWSIDDVGEVRRKIEERVSSIRTVDMTWKVTSLFTQEHGNQISSTPFSDEKTETQGKFPATFQWKAHLWCDGPKLRLEHARPSWDFDRSKFGTPARILVEDGIVTKSLTTFKDGSFPNQAVIGNDPTHIIADMEFSPVLWHFRAFAHRGMLGDRFFESDAIISHELLDGRKMLVVKQMKRPRTETAMELILWLDPDAQYAVRRFSTLLNSRLRMDIHMDYMRTSDDHVVPEQWRLEQYNDQSLLTASHSSRVLEMSINQRIEPTVFNLDFPVGTAITDQRGNQEKYMLMGAGGHEYRTTPQKTGRAASPEVLEALLKAEQQPNRGWPWSLLVLALLAGGILAGVFYCKLRRNRVAKSFVGII